MGQRRGHRDSNQGASIPGAEAPVAAASAVAGFRDRLARKLGALASSASRDEILAVDWETTAQPERQPGRY